MAKKPKEKTTKEIAARIDPIYFRSWHRLRKARFFLSVGLVERNRLEKLSDVIVGMSNACRNPTGLVRDWAR